MRRCFRCLVATASSLAVLACVSSLHGTTLRVPQDHATIQAALDAAGDGDDVVVAPGTYDLTRPIVFRGKMVALRSAAGPESTLLRMGVPEDPTRGSLVAFENGEPPGAALEGFTLEGGRGTVKTLDLGIGNRPGPVRAGGAVYCGSHAAPRIAGNILRGNTAEFGGAVLCDVDSAAVLAANEFVDNQVPLETQLYPGPSGGALACLPDSITVLDGGKFRANRAFDGGALYVGSGASIELRDVRFELNEAADDGGAFLFHGEKLRLTGGWFAHNRARDSGGALRIRDTAMGNIDVLLEDTLFLRNQAGDGGAVFCFLQKVGVPPGQVPPGLKVLRTRFLENRASGNGGGLCGGYDSNAIEVEDCEFLGNKAYAGGGIFGGYTVPLKLTRCDFVRNSAHFGGGLNGGDDGTCDILDSTIRENAAFVYGGGIYKPGSGRMLLVHSTVAANSAVQGGGGIFSVFLVSDLESCVVWGNAGGSIVNASASFSCVERDGVLPGQGNINQDPGFAGWTGAETVHVDGANAEIGDGTAGNPYASLRQALEGYSIALVRGSPCLGTGSGGSNMGAPLSVVDVPGKPARLVKVAVGFYELDAVHFGANVSLEGRGPADTWLVGPVAGLRTGTTLTGVTVWAGSPFGIGFGPGDSPSIAGCVVTGTVPRSALGCGVYCGPGSTPLLVHCTVAGNSGFVLDLGEPRCGEPGRMPGGGVFVDGAIPRLESCIVWSNAGGSVSGATSLAVVNRCCIEGSLALTGEGNINQDPLFAGWELAEVHVDQAHAGSGDGSPADPFSSLDQALRGWRGHDFSLRAGSPAIGAGEGGSNMGAIDGVAARAGFPSRRIHVAPGRYDVSRLGFALHVSLEGAGADATVLEGSLFGLRTGASLSGVTVEGGDYPGAVYVSPCESPEIRSSTIARSLHGIFCDDAPARIVGCTIQQTQGAGVLCRGIVAPTLEECILMSSGVGLYSFQAPARLVNCILAGNSLAGAQLDSAPVTLVNCTLARNGSHSILCGASAPRVINCILWRGVTPDQGCGTLTGSIVGVNPLFVREPQVDFNRFTPAPLSLGSGSLPDYVVDLGDLRLRPGSPAIDAGTAPDAPAQDIDGNPRSCGAAVDAGAHESGCGPPVTFRRGNANADASTDIADAVFTLGYLFTGGRAPPCEAAADMDSSGGLNISDPIFILQYLFLGGEPPPEPFAACGPAGAGDELTCFSFPPCE